MISSVFSIRHLFCNLFYHRKFGMQNIFLIFIHFVLLITNTEKNREKLAFHVFFLAIQALLW